MKTKISVYLKAGKKAATSYYRFFQFFDNLSYNYDYKLMIPDNYWNSFFPISIQPKVKQVFIFLFIYLRVLFFLFIDAISPPTIIIVSRRFVNRVFPISYKALLIIIKKRGSKLIWDFDDNIIFMKEVSRSGFNWLSKYSDVIIVGSPFLKDYIKDSYREKVTYLPTTDGDMYGKLSPVIQENRVKELDSIVRIVWVGTFTGLKHIQDIIDAFELFGQYLSSEGKRLSFSVVCDFPLDYKPSHFDLNNVKWERNVAINEMFKAHIGIMPLIDNENTRGKCGFKLIQYLSAGLPVVGSAVGMNKLIIKPEVGYCLKSADAEEWFESFKSIVHNKETWVNYSKCSLKEWEANYSFDNNLRRWDNLFSSMLKN